MAQLARLTVRLQKELKLLLSDPPPGVSFPFLSSDSDAFSLSTIDAQIEGPEGTVYSKGKFQVKIQIPERYPFQPPNVTFVTPIYHPNIDNGGRICLDILNLPPKGAWQPSLNISTVMTSIGLLLSEPNPDDGLMCEMSREYKYNRCAFDQKARAMTEKYAKAGVCGNSSNSQNVQTNALADDKQSEGSRHVVSANDGKPCGISRKLSLAPSRSTHKEDNDREPNAQLNFANMEAKIEERMLSANHYQQQNFQHSLDTSSDSTSNSKGKEALTVRKKLSLGIRGLPEGQRKDEKENILPINKIPHSNPENRMKTEIVQKQPTNETRNQKHNRDQIGILTERIQQPREEIPEPESVIVLDSEDSEEEQDVAMRSKLSLVRKRIGKRKTRA